MPKRIDRNVDARNVVYSGRSSVFGSDALVDQVLDGEQARDVRLRLLDARCRFPSAPAARSSGARPTVMLCGPSPCISSWTRMCVKNASNDTSF